MKRETKRIEQLLANATAGRQLVREEMAAGASLQQVYDELGQHEQIFSQRLRDLNAWNEKQDSPAGQTPKKRKFTHNQLNGRKPTQLNHQQPKTITTMKKTQLKFGFSLIIGLFVAFAVPAGATQSFNFTNIIRSGISVTSFPTNTATTNLLSNSSFGTSTNGSTITTNGYYYGYLTGNGIDVNNYEKVGFVFKAITTSSNSAIMSFALVRGYGNGNSTVPIIAGDPLGLSGWETAPTAYLQVPVAAGTNIQTTWSTNLDVFYTAPADQIGIYSCTNNLSLFDANGWASNIVVGLHKKILPLKFP